MARYPGLYSFYLCHKLTLPDSTQSQKQDLKKHISPYSSTSNLFQFDHVNISYLNLEYDHFLKFY